MRTRESSTELPPATSGSTSASSLLPKQVPHPQDSLQLQPRGGATTNREIPLPQLPTSGLQFGILSSKSQASTLGSLTFTVPPLRQASPPVSSSQQTLPGGGRGSGTEPPPPAAKFSPVFHASLSQVCTLVSASLTRKMINLSLFPSPSPLLPSSLPPSPLTQGGGKMRSHRSPRHVSRKDSSSEVNPMELPPAVPLASNVPSFLFTAQLQVCGESALIRIFRFTILSTLNTHTHRLPNHHPQPLPNPFLFLWQQAPPLPLSHLLHPNHLVQTQPPPPLDSR